MLYNIDKHGLHVCTRGRIAGYQAVSLAFPLDGQLQEWGGLGKKTNTQALEL